METAGGGKTFLLDLKGQGAAKLRSVIQQRLSEFSDSFTDEVLAVSCARGEFPFNLRAYVRSTRQCALLSEFSDSTAVGTGTSARTLQYYRAIVLLCHCTHVPLWCWSLLQEYVGVLVAHGKTRAQVKEDLEEFLGDKTQGFVNW